MSNAQLCNTLAIVMREKYKDNAVEALVGALSSVVTDEQLQTLIKANS
jgi:hypothetical protein